MGTRILNAKEALIKFLDDRKQQWKRQDPDELDRAGAILDERITIIGTSKHEVFKGPKDVKDQWKKESAQIHTETYAINWIEETILDDRTSIVNCEIEWQRELTRNVILTITHRASTIWHRDNGQFKMVLWHSSSPDGASEHEVFPGSSEPKIYPEISILFTDIVGFTKIAASFPVRTLVDELNELFMVFDAKTKQFGLDKIKTIGDSYMLVGGLKGDIADHAERCIRWSHDVLEYLDEHNSNSKINWQLRIGIHSGSAIGGVIGQEKPVFDLWGDTVNTASRMESSGEVDQVNISKATYELVKNNSEFSFKTRGKVMAKGKGEMEMYFVTIT